MRKVYCYAEKEEKPEEIDHSGDIVQDLSSLDISDIKNRRFFFIGGEIIENPYYEPSEYMKRVYAAIDAQYEKFYRSDKDKKDSEEKDDVKDAEEEINEQSSDDDMPDWIAEMPYGELIKRFPGGISEALEYAKKEKGLSVPEVHYDSPEPEKLGVKAFTKNAEVYLAPGEGEETLKHELGHVVQQKKEKIPATTKIGEQQVNLDPKFEQEADEIAEHIEDHITEIISNESTNTETKDVIQFELPEGEELWRQIKTDAKNMGISENFINQESVKSAIINKVEKYYNSLMWWAWWEMTYKNDNYLDTCIIWGLNSIKSENSKECNLYSELEKSKPENNGEEKARITEIMAMLSTEKIFEHTNGDSENLHTLHEIFSKLNKDQSSKLKECILILQKYCDAEGVKSVLKSANKNDAFVIIDFTVTNETDTLRLCDFFIRRLKLMTDYIEKVAGQICEVNGAEKRIGDEYWIRSTGSDPHKDGEHALFLIPKTPGPTAEATSPTEECEEPIKFPPETRVYKPHDLSADNAVVGENGMFDLINRLFKECDVLKDTVIAGEDAFATMKIDVGHNVEEFVRKEGSMSQDEAKKYFFRAGMLKVITDVMAIIDLHGDNIMPVMIRGGGIAPLITDAEIDFFQYTGSGLVENALSRDQHNRRDLNSCFVVEGEGQKSSELFNDTESDYHKAYEMGYNFMVEQMYDYKEAFVDFYEKELRKVVKVRILPLPTNMITQYLHDYMKNEVEIESGDDVDNFLGLILRQLSLTNGFIFGINEDKTSKDKLKKAIISAFKAGTIIALYANMNGKIYLDNVEIGEFKVDPQSPDTIIEVMKQRFLDEICTLFMDSGLRELRIKKLLTDIFD